MSVLLSIAFTTIVHRAFLTHLYSQFFSFFLANNHQNKNIPKAYSEVPLVGLSCNLHIPHICVEVPLLLALLATTIRPSHDRSCTLLWFLKITNRIIVCDINFMLHRVLVSLWNFTITIKWCNILIQFGNN